MKKIGNGDPQNCVNNIMNVSRGEVPYLRGMGLDSSLYDKPVGEAEPLLIVDVQEQIETYEERVEINEINSEISSEGNIKIIPNITIME